MENKKITQYNYEDFKINTKILLSSLWASVTLCYLYGDYFELYVPQKTSGLVSGQNLLDSPAKLMSAAVLLAIPSVMVALSIILKPRVNRVLNIIFGTMFTAIMVLIAVTSFTPWKAFYVFLALLESVLTSLIVWYAWKWPRQRGI
ncbi:MAG: hypothetical protein IT269_11800 [Saprospiraceae bacterium]|nr:hypothetical protein [Saprospiraceae bacterium]